MKKTPYTLSKIRATDNSKLGQLSTDATMTISLQDANEPPTIASNAFVVNEAIEVGSEVGQMSAKDIDAGEVLTYRITAGNEDRAFNIEFKTGMIKVTEQLDFETTTMYTLSIRVTDKGTNTADAKCEIRVTNINEPPYFVESSDYTRNLDEIEYVQEPRDGKVYCVAPYDPHAATTAACKQEYTTAKRVLSGGSVTAKDPDAGDMALLKYSLDDVRGTGRDNFEIDENTGVITTINEDNKDKYDYEVQPNEYDVWVIATDPKGLTDAVQVVIRIDDINEKPRLTTLGFGVAENFVTGMFVGQLSSTDADLYGSQTMSYELVGTGNTCRNHTQTAVREQDLVDRSETDLSANPLETDPMGGTWKSAQGRVRCAAGSGGQFRLTPSGELYVNKDHQTETNLNLFLERHETYVLGVKVTDDGSNDGNRQSYTSEITIQVWPANKPPVVHTKSINFPETTLHTPVQGWAVGIPVQAEDKDGDNLVFSIVGGNGGTNKGDAFRIDPTTGQIYVDNHEALNYEKRQRWDLRIQVRDDGKGELIDVATVTVMLYDVNEYPIIVEQARTINENALVDTNVGDAIEASDVDAAKWGELQYLIVGGNTDELFKIHDKNGQITVKREGLDFERESQYALTVRVVDTQGSGYSDEARVTITVVDINDSPVVESGVSPRTIYENSKPGSLVGIAIAASDQDARDSLTYSITGANCWKHTVASGSIAGSNYFVPSLDKNGDGDVEVSLRVKSAKGDVVVDLAGGAGGSDGVDADNKYRVILHESGINGVRAVRVSSSVEYDLPCSNADLNFLPRGGLDFNAIKIVAQKDGTLVVESTRSGAQATCGPVRTAGAPKWLGCYQDNGARDFCCGPKKYGYTSDTCATACAGFKYFALQDNGWCTCDNDYSTPAQTYPKRSDTDCNKGGKRMGGAWRNSVFEQTTAVTSLTPTAVGVTSVGGSPVQFESICFKTTLPSARTAGSDPISSPSTAASIFKIDSETGQITVTEESRAAVLDYESVASFSLEITVSDDGSPRKETKTTVGIQILNEFEAPIITSTPCKGFRSCLKVIENSPIATRVGAALQARDQDLGHLVPVGSKRSDVVTHGPLKWSITGGNWGNRFSIDEGTGQISVALALDVDDGSSMLNHESSYVEVGGSKVNSEGNPVFHLTVNIRDPTGLEDEAIVEIAVSDVNEPPLLLDTMRKVPEDAALNHLVGPPLDASDEDDSDTPQGKFKYMIESIQYAHFNYLTGAMDSSTCGTLTCTMSGPYRGAVRAPTLTCTGALSGLDLPAGQRVVVTRGTTTTSLVVSSTEFISGDFVMKLAADVTSAGRAEGLAESEGEKGWATVCPSWRDAQAVHKTIFAITESTGQLSIVNPDPLDFEADANIYRVVVSAIDNIPNGPGMTTRAEIMIRLEDRNERPVANDQSMGLAGKLNC